MQERPSIITLVVKFTAHETACKCILHVRDNHDVMLHNLGLRLVFSPSWRQQRQRQKEIHLQAILLKLMRKRVHPITAVRISITYEKNTRRREQLL
jgi:hypothetical protein